MATSTTTTTTDLAFEALAHRHRRAVLRHLVELDGFTTLDQLVEVVLDGEDPTTGHLPTRGEVRSALRHIHLPKLRRAGVIDYDGRGGTVRYFENDTVENLLRACS